MLKSKSFNMISIRNQSFINKSFNAFNNNHMFLRSCTFKIRSTLITQPSYQFLTYSKANAYYRLCRWDKPIGALLLYWPVTWGLCIGSSGIVSFYLISLFLMGSWTSRSAGCIVNDYFDRQFDRKVQRTKLRPLASGQVSTKQAGALLFLNLCGGLFVLFHMNLLTLVTTFSFVGLGAIYPLAKRYTNYPQFVLGLGYNSGIIIGCLTASNGVIVSAAIPLYASGIAWTLIYDTVYAYQDIDDDVKIGVKSTAVTWEKKDPKLIMQRLVYLMGIFQMMLPFLDKDFIFSLPFLLGTDCYLVKAIRQLDLKDKTQCGQFFKKNNIIGLLIFLSLFFYTCVKNFKKDRAEQK